MAGYIQRHLPDTRSGSNLDPLIATIMIDALVFFWSQNCHYYASPFEEPFERVTDRYLD
jgi:hypothetical protein